MNTINLSNEAMDRKKALEAKDVRITEALEKAMILHASQVRKVRKYAFIEHPIAVAYTLLLANASVETIIAGILHDSVEDTSYKMEQVEEDFGFHVARLVASNTEQKYNEDGTKKSWDERKQHTIDTVSSKTEEELQLLIADKLDNLLSLRLDIEAIESRNEDLLTYFKRGIQEQIWYFTEIANQINITKYTTPFFHTYIQEVEKFTKDFKNHN